MATTGTKMAIHAAAKAAGIPNYKKMPLGKLIPLLPDDVQQILKLGKFGADKMKAYGGKAKKKMAKGGKTFPDLTGDGKVTQADILKGRGVFAYGGKAKKKKMMGGGKVHKKMYAMGGGMRKAKTYG